ncbi:MAG: hypothetical protein FJZ57_03040 [Chlamydiae bacterium]|nr:hypothetical protein [Chlamydiota bacterium]
MAQNRSSFTGIYSTFLQTFGVCLLLTSTLSARELTPQQSFMLKRIAEYWKEGDSSLAKSQILSFLSKYPESSALDNLYAMLGDIYIQEKDYESANVYYEKINSDEVASKTVFNKIICLFELQKTDEVITQITKTIANPTQIQDTETLKFLLAESLQKKALSYVSIEDKEHVLLEALPLYEGLIHGKYGEHSLLPAAQIAEKLNKYPDACTYYTMYLRQNPDQNEAVLLKIALLQESFKPKEAVKTYSNLYKLRGPYSSKAAFNQLKILYKEQNYKDLLFYQEQAIEHLSGKELLMAHYWIGKSLLHLEDFNQSKKHLLIALSNSELSNVDQKVILSNLITCAGKTRDSSLLNSLIEKWEKIDSLDPSLADAYLLKFQILNIIDKKGACEALEKIVTLFPSFQDREPVLFNLASLQYKMEQWEASAHTLSNLLIEFPQSKFSNMSYRMKLNCLIEDVNTTAQESKRLKKTTLVEFLQESLLNKKAFSSSELNNYHYIYCKTLFEIDRTEDAIYEIQNFIEKNVDQDSLAKAYLLMANFYGRNDEDIPLFITAAEKALSFEQEIEDKNTLHSKLFNAYLISAENSTGDQKDELIDKAALHLFSSFECGSKLKKNNAYWLSNHFYGKIEKQQYMPSLDGHHLIEKTIALIENILDINHYPPSSNIKNEAILNEVEMLKLSDLLGRLNKKTEKLDVLEVLVYQQKKYPNIEWKYPRKALLELAATYSDIGLVNDAIDTYDHLITSSEFASSYIANVAIIEKCRLKYKILDATDFDNEAPEFLSILDDLKSLEIRKKIYSEPTHLEAGLTYIDLKTAHMHKDKKVEKELHLLEILKNNFSNSDDPAITEYLSPNNLYPEKKEVYKNYLKYIDSLIYLKKAELCLIEKRRSEAPSLIRSAIIGFRELADSKNLPLDLSKRIHSKLEAMEKTL